MVNLLVKVVRFKIKFIVIMSLIIKPILEVIFNNSHGPVYPFTKEILLIDYLIAATI